MKHRHYEMIVAKAANMDLVIMSKNSRHGKWSDRNDQGCKFSEEFDYFLCLPQHKEACLHWLNGGHVQWGSTEHEEFDWYDKDTIGINSIEEDAKYFLCPTIKVRIAPRKEKRWIAISDKENHIFFFDTKSEVEKNICMYYSKDNYQIIEIEVEV